MKEVKMTPEILHVICAVTDYHNFLISDNIANPKEYFNCFREVEKYFNQLPLPNGLERNADTLITILSYTGSEELKVLKKTNYDQLGQYEF